MRPLLQAVACSLYSIHSMKHLLGAFLLSLPLLGNAAELNLPLLPDGAAANIAKKAPPELAAPLNAAIEQFRKK